MSGKIREKSGNFKVDDKWQPCLLLATVNFEPGDRDEQTVPTQGRANTVYYSPSTGFEHITVS